ncbi:uncharacterized protein LOC134685154 isoform X1 [Mytilus trossulus]|uniref:uncharacterized protein LOC134685154 isoform X1 n=2 Tax=Mytilus trossulus TaxID=6551 RepID=UPI003007E586
MLLVYVFGTMLVSMFIYFKKIFRRTRNKELIVFSRYPIPGTTKTRLIPAVGEDCAAYCQLRMTDHILNIIEDYCRKDDDISVNVYYNGGTYSQMKYWLGRRKNEVTWQQQANGGLGNKLSSAFKDSFKRNSKHTIIIGSDIPGINSNVISEAYHKLQNGSDMVLGPAADGGYYLVGISKSANVKLDDVFSDINWGTETVFREQSERAKYLGISLGILDTRLNDVDVAADLEVLENELQVTREQLAHPKISIIIPVYNEADNILSTLETVLKKCSRTKAIEEIIVSDGGSTDDTVSVVEKFAKTKDVAIKVVKSSPGRGFQQKYGSEQAKGDIFMFLHADTEAPDKFDHAIVKCLQKPGNVGGCFRLGFDVVEAPEREQKCSKIFKMKMNFLQWITNNIRVKYLERPYGDQILFVTRENYFKAGGFKEVYLMEDYMMVEDLNKFGHICVADADPVITSSRRWKKLGLIRTTGMTNLIVLAYKLGVPPNKLAEWYYGDKLKEIQKRAKQT